MIRVCVQMDMCLRAMYVCMYVCMCGGGGEHNNFKFFEKKPEG